ADSRESPDASVVWARTSYLGVLGKNSPTSTGYDGSAGNEGVFGYFNSTGHKINEIIDGLSNTTMVGERPPDVIPGVVAPGVFTSRDGMGIVPFGWSPGRTFVRARLPVPSLPISRRA